MRNGPYELVIAPEDYPGFRYRGRYIYEHHLVWWRRTGTLVSSGHVVHHKNDNKRDNRFSNLELKTNSQHTAEHARARTKPVIVDCGWCGKTLSMLPYRYRQRLYGKAHGKVFCSQRCGAFHQFHTP